MNEKSTMKSAFVGWGALIVAYVVGRKHGREKYINKVRDSLLSKLIKEREEKGS